MSIRPDKLTRSRAASAFGEYHRLLHKFLLRRLANAEDASDAMQEVFLRLLRLPPGHLVRSPQAYLYGIASHVVREFRARSARERVTFDSEIVEERAQRPATLARDELADGLGLQRQIEAALTQLSNIELRILLHDRRDGLSLEQIAQKTGLSVHTVKKYLFRALSLVRTQLQQHDRQE